MENPNSTAAVLDAGLWIGRQQAFAMIAGKCSAAQAAAIKQLHETKAYDSLGLTWEEFCVQHLGVCRATADSILRRYNELGENYFRLAEICRVSPETYVAIQPKIEGECIELNGQQIALIPENASKIRAAIKNIRDTLDTRIDFISDFETRIKHILRDINHYNQVRQDKSLTNNLISVLDAAAGWFRGLAKELVEGPDPFRKK